MKLNIKKIERERKKRNLTMRAFSKRIQITPAAYSFLIRSGSTKITTINRIADVLDLNPKDLFI